MKLRDAANQMLLALQNDEDEEKFRSCINAFVSAARSTTMVMERECDHVGMTDWYKSTIATVGKSPMFKFFNEQRVYSIHKGVIQPDKTQHKVSSVKFLNAQSTDKKKRLSVTATIHAETLTIQARDITKFADSGNIWAWRFTGVEKHLPGDSGNVLRLCEDYYSILKWLIEEAIRERHRRGFTAS